MNRRFGELLFQHRRTRTLLQKQVALEAGIDPSYLAGLENGRRPPPEKSTLNAIIQALALTSDETTELTAQAASEKAARYLQTNLEDLPGIDCLVQLALALPSLSQREISTIEALIETLVQRKH
jgi:transcriptional regulator with XRE-family HTH domain